MALRGKPELQWGYPMAPAVPNAGLILRPVSGNQNPLQSFSLRKGDPLSRRWWKYRVSAKSGSVIWREER